MRVYKVNIAQGIGDNIMARCFADLAKDKYDKMYFTHHSSIVQIEKNNSPEYWNFLYDLGKLFFSNDKYIYKVGEHRFRNSQDIIQDLNIIPQKPQRNIFVPLLCKGKSLNLGQKYIVITTKLRNINKYSLYLLFPQFWKTINNLSKKYKIVILGEKTVEMCHDYLLYGQNRIFGIYEQIISNLSSDKILDLTIPTLGITSPTLNQIQQDCLIMNEAEFVITLGHGGNFCMAMAVSNMIGYRMSIDGDQIADTIFSNNYADAFVTKNWNEFIEKLNSQL